MPSATGAIWAITRAELLRVSRDRVALFFIVALPLLIIVLIGATTAAAARHLPLGLLVEDPTSASVDGSVSSAVTAGLRTSESLTVRDYSALDDMERDIRTGTIAAGVVVPARFDVAVDDGGPAKVMLYAGSHKNGEAAASVVQSVMQETGVRHSAVTFVREISGLDANAAMDVVDRTSSRLPLVGVDARVVGHPLADQDNPYAYTVPSNLVMFVFVNSLAVSALLAESKRRGVARRMLAAPVTASTLVMGMGTARFVFALMQSALIIGIGRMLFGVTWGSPPAALALTVAYALVSTGAGLLIGAFVKNPEQGQAVGIPVAIGMGMLGGTMWPLEIVPPVVRAIGHLTPQAWAMDGWIALIFEGEGIQAIWLDLTVLVGLAAVLIIIASVLLRRSLQG